MLGAAMLLLGGSSNAITVSEAWDSPTGASPQVTAARTFTVPATNPGDVTLDIVLHSGGTLAYQKNSDPFVSFVDAEGASVASGDTMRFRLTGAGESASVIVRDVLSAGAIAPAFTITNT
ncbi:MAG TPA: hypothetical protein VEA80_04850 [Vitreimonas sp.]|uniref:hypothetical protein n=1 Tax=Vitreimonas sp. TaxID=3069702 RepID=UPI002D5AA6F4|nr:hypothetical protein [Vitreimonas sp.]HYD86780.1 hypothetical protein [Vitreimonas sp.]